MAKVKFRIKINKGRRGAAMGKLGLLYQDINKFFQKAMSDWGVDVESDFLADDFKNESVNAATEYPFEVTHEIEAGVTSDVLKLLKYRPSEQAVWSGRLSTSTLAQYAKIGEHLDADEDIWVGFDRGANEPQWESVTKTHTRAVRESITAIVRYYGAVFGRVHSWSKETKEPHFVIQEVGGGQLVSCYYAASQYPQIHSLLKDREAFVHVAGMITANRITGGIDHLDAEQFAVGAAVTDSTALEARMAGGKSEGSASERISHIRDDDRRH